MEIKGYTKIPKNRESRLAILKEITNSAIKLLYVNDGFLLENDACELSIAHKLAIYYSYFINGYDIDIEYNRKGFNPDPKALKDFYKILPIIEKNKIPENLKEMLEKLFGKEISKEVITQKIKAEFKNLKKKIEKDKIKNIVPDIIIHTRGINLNNMLTIEIKKNAKPEEAFYDIIKLYSMRKEYKYKHAVFINFLVKKSKYETYWIKYNDEHDKIDFCKKTHVICKN